MGNVYFPASGCRGKFGSYGDVGKEGYYQSTTVDDKDYGFNLFFTDTYIRMDQFDHPDFGFSIRCVKKVDPTGSY
jgi:hypothetical protein